VRKPVFGFCGAAGAGKDSVANYLHDHYGVARFGFSWPLKDLVCKAYGWDRKQIDNYDYKSAVAPVRSVWRDEVAEICWGQFDFDRPISAQRAVIEHVERGLNEPARVASTVGEKPWTRRRVLQHIGTEVFRAIDPHHWTTKALRCIEELLKTEVGVAVVDVRFLNEAAALRDAFRATIMRVERTDEEPSADTHSSELEFHQIPVDWVLAAPFGQLPKLYEQANSIARLSGLRAK